MTAEATTMPTEVPDRRRWLALVVLCVGMLMIVLDVTVVNVALPSIQSDLQFSQSSLAWVVNAYLISFGGLLLLAGRLDDVRRDPRDDRDHVPRAARAGEGDRDLRLRGVRRRLDRPARRRRPHRGDQLALDLLHQPPDRDRHGAG